MGYISAQQTRYSHLISGFLIIAILLVSAGSANAGTFITQCNDCHGMPPKDGASRKGNPHFRSYSAATVGNHTTHLSPSPVANDCVVCHGTAVSAISTATHQNDVINMAAATAIKGGSYTKGVFFNQTSIPVLTAATCASVGCHFETITPAWGSAVLASPAGCSACHLASPISLSHQKHTATYSFACTACHTDHSGEAKPFAHATSVGRPISVPVGNYTGSNDRYLPSQATGRILGSCTTAYCHSTVQAATGLGNGTGQSVTWGGAVLSCGGCHQNMATDAAGTGSHPLHATATTTANGTGVNYTCQVCHGTLYSRTKTPAGGTHVNNAINLSFTTISGATAAGTVYAKGTTITPGSAIYGRCSTSACHGAGTPVWGTNTALPECFKCHGSTAGTYTNTSSATIAPGGGTSGRDTGGNTLATSPRVGAHQTHLNGTDNISSPIHCGECHTTHLTVKDSTHLNYTTATISFGPLAKTASHAPGVVRSTGVITCNNTYCHTGNRTGATALATTPVFTSNSLIGGTSLADTCTAKCHGMPPGGGVAGDTHASLGASGTYTTLGSLSACSSQIGGTGCHSTLNSAPATMAAIFFDKTMHINGTVESSGHTFPFKGSAHMTAAGTTPWSSCSCHNATATGVTYATWASTLRGTAPNCTTCHTGGLKVPSGTSSCWDCHGSTAINGQPNGAFAAFPNWSGSHTNHIAKTYVCDDCHFNAGTGRATHGNYSGVTKTRANVAVAFNTAKSGTAATWAAGTMSCSTSNCHGQKSPVWGQALPSHECFFCHGLQTAPVFTTFTSANIAPGTGNFDTGRATGITARGGVHQEHLKGSAGISEPVKCRECHVPVTTVTQASHLNYTTATVTFSGTATAAGHTTATASRASGLVTCSSTYCHTANRQPGTAAGQSGVNTSPVWNNGALIGGTSLADTCINKCHALPPGAGVTSDTHSALAAVTTINGLSACSSQGNASGCHPTLNALPTTMATIFFDKAKHINGTVEAAGHNFPYSGASHMTNAGTTPWSSCSNCHNATATGVTYATWASTLRGTAPNCTTCHAGGLKVPSGASSCWDCHGVSAINGQPNGGVAAFPNYSGSHPAHVTRYGMLCDNCHNGAGTGATTHGNSNGLTKTRADVILAFTGNLATPIYTAATLTCTTACHVAAVWGSHLDCIGCHSSTVVISHGPLANGVNTRRAVAAEIKSSGTRNHKQTAAGSDAIKWDCIVCHMEGNATTGEPDPVYHGSGVINFRDPDTGTAAKKVAWSGTGAAGRYVDTLTNFTTARFYRDMSVVLESDPNWLKVASIQMNLCLKCHDANGAVSSTAWTKTAAGNTTGSALRPFGNAVASTATLIQIKSGQAAGNTTYNAAGDTAGSVMNVAIQLDPNNAAYHPVLGKGNNGFTGGTQMKAPWSTATSPAKVARTNTVYGWLVSCFDCHASSAAAGNSTYTVVAHGNGTTATTATMRGPSEFVQGTAAAPNLCTTCHADTYATTSNQHASGASAFNGGSSMGTATMGVCKNCHGTYTDTVGARAVGAHGADVTESGLAVWPTTSSRPYAFVRGTNWTYWGPGSCSNACTTRTYSPGGMY